MNNKTIEQKIQRTEKEITRLEHQKKIKQHEAKQLERNRRNRRIFTRGGMLERFMQRPLLLTDDQVYRLLQTAFNTEAVQTMEIPTPAGTGTTRGETHGIMKAAEKMPLLLGKQLGIEIVKRLSHCTTNCPAWECKRT